MGRLAGAATTSMMVSLSLFAASCGSGRSFDNPPPEVSPEPLERITSPSTQPPTTPFVPSTAPTTLAPPTQPPPAPTDPPQAPAPTQQEPATPAPTSVTTTPDTITDRYTVVRGDTLFEISTKLGVELDLLLAANGMTAGSLIVPGQTLAVPTGGSVTDAAQEAGTQEPAAPAPGTQAPVTQGPGAGPAPPEAPPPTDGADTSPPSTQVVAATTTSPVLSGAVQPGQTSASCQAESSQDAAGTPVDFGPGNVLDRNPATAWRCAAGTAQTITFEFEAPTRLVSVGLVNGYVKVDVITGVDRYVQNHRIRQATWTFDDGTVVTQDFADDTRTMQTMPVDVTTRSVTLAIVSTYAPGGEAPRDMVPVADVQFLGG